MTPFARAGVLLPPGLVVGPVFALPEDENEDDYYSEEDDEEEDEEEEDEEEEPEWLVLGLLRLA